ncbi:MAG: adenosine deaminase [Acidobacteria bacterium]|nr:adenosine deaminase [Acidobacteriota bacterium]
MRELIHQLPKAELHVHLEGAVEPETLREIAPLLTGEEIRARYSYEDFGQFLTNFGWVASHLREPAHYAIATRRLLERLQAQNVRYAEITLSAGVVLWKGQDLASVHEAVRQAAKESPIEVWWIWDAVRQWGGDAAQRVAEMATERATDGVIAFGLGGDEAQGPAKQFRKVFAFAKKRGLRLVCHAGEMLGAESVWQALEAGAERIGHGIGAIEDSRLVRYMAGASVPLEICITSNFKTGAARKWGEYPLRRLLDAGVPVILNTDDPAMFQTSLEAEYERAWREFGVAEDKLRAIAQNGFRCAFGWNRAVPA